MNIIMLISHNYKLLYQKVYREVLVMPDYEKLYKQMVNAAEDALKILIESQRNCEEMYISEAERREPFTCPENESSL